MYVLSNFVKILLKGLKLSKEDKRRNGRVKANRRIVETVR